MSSITRINRDDMLELTRRMTIARTSMTRIAGSYMDADGFIDGTFNTNFLKLKNSKMMHFWNLFMTTLQKITIQIMIMQYISSIILMISLSKQPITKASGNPKKSTNISSVQSVRFPVIMNLVNQNVVSFFRHLIPEQKIRTTLISTKVIRIFPKKTY